MTASTQELFLGTRITGNLVVLAPEERQCHLYVVGQTGTGKSTLLSNLIAQALTSGAGFALLDLHGDLAEAVLRIAHFLAGGNRSKLSTYKLEPLCSI